MTLTPSHDDPATDALHRGMYACIAGSYGSASLGFTLIYQAGLAGQRFSVFTRFPRFSHAPFPFGFRVQVGEMTQRS